MFLADLRKRVSLDLHVAQQGDTLKSGHVYFAPQDMQLRIVKKGKVLSLDLSAEAPLNGQRPSSDALFESAAQALSSQVTAVLLSGFGSDGIEGLKSIKAHGGLTLVENPDGTSHPFLLPKGPLPWA